MEFSTQSILALFSIGGAGAILSRFLDTQDWFAKMNSSNKATTVAVLSSILGIASTILLNFVPQDTWISLDAYIKPYIPFISMLLPIVLSFLSTQVSYALDKFTKAFNETEEIKLD